MPEGPEVRRSADKIERAVANSPLRCIFEYDTLQPVEDLFSNVQLTSIDTYGKAFVLHFSNDHSIYVHLQLYGRWKTGRLQSYKPSRRTLRMRLETDTHYATLYSATDIEVLTPQTVEEHLFIRKLGPNILKNGYTASHISRRLGKTTFARRSLGGLLLDQSVFAGLGNYLRSEILLRAGLLPSRKLGSLSTSEKTLLAKMIHETTHRAYQTAGITLNSEYVAIAKEQGWRRSQYRHFVFDRERSTCWLCTTKIEKIHVSGRRLYLCKTCQS
jgi:endonuclease VIII